MWNKLHKHYLNINISMKIILSFSLLLTLLGFIDGYQKEDLKLLYIVTDNSFTDSSSALYLNNYTSVNFKRNPEILSLLQVTTFKDIRRLSMFIQNYYNSTDIEVEYRDDDILSELTGIILYEAIKNTETNCESWRKRLSDKWNRKIGTTIYVYESQSCNDLHLRNYFGNEGLLFLQNFLQHAKSIKDNKITYNSNKIFSANFVIMEKLIQRFNLSGLDNNNRPSRSLMFELVYSVTTNIFEIQVGYYSGFNNDSNTSPEYLNFGNSKHNVTIEEFEQLLNFSSQLNSCNKKISEPTYEQIEPPPKTLNSTDEVDSESKTPNFPDNKNDKNQTNPVTEFDEQTNNTTESSKNVTAEFEKSGNSSLQNNSTLVQLSPDEQIGETNSDGENLNAIAQELTDFDKKVNKPLKFVVESSILVGDDKQNSDGNKKSSSVLLGILLTTVLMLILH